MLSLGFDDRRQRLQPRVAEKDRKLLGDQALPEVRVAVPVRSERRL
jgi:hypothetical protein